MAFSNAEPRVPCLLDNHRQGITDKAKHSRMSWIKEREVSRHDCRFPEASHSSIYIGEKRQRID